MSLSYGLVKSKFLEKNQGASEAGKVLAVGNTGNVVTQELEARGLKSYAESEDFGVLMTAAIASGDKVVDITGEYTLAGQISVSGQSDMAFSGTAKIQISNDITTVMYVHGCENVSFGNLVFDCGSHSFVNGVYVLDGEGVHFDSVEFDDVLAYEYNSETSGYSDTICVRNWTSKVSYGRVSLKNVVSKTGGTIGAAGALVGVYVQTDATHVGFDCGDIYADGFYNKIENSSGEWVRGIRDADVLVTKYTGATCYPSFGRIHSGIRVGCICAHDFDKRFAKIMSGGVSIGAIVGDNKDSTVSGESVAAVTGDNVTIGHINVWMNAAKAIEVGCGAHDVKIHDSDIQGKFQSYGILCLTSTSVPSEVASLYDNRNANCVFDNVHIRNEETSASSIHGMYFGSDGDYYVKNCDFEFAKALRLVRAYGANITMKNLVLEGCRFKCDALTEMIGQTGNSISGLMTVVRNCRFECVFSRSANGQYWNFFAGTGNETVLEGLEFDLTDTGSYSCSQAVQVLTPVKVNGFRLTMASGSITPGNAFRSNSAKCEMRDVVCNETIEINAQESVFLENLKTGTVSVKAVSGYTPTAKLFNCALYSIGSGVTATVIDGAVTKITAGTGLTSSTSGGECDIGLSAATSSTLGGVKVGSGLSVASDGTLSSTGSGAGGFDATGVAEAYSSSSTYAVGDLCTHNNKLWRCNETFSTAKDWDDEDWTETCVSDEFCKMSTLVVTATTQDGVTVTGQTVTVREGGASGNVYATASYNGQPVSFTVPRGFSYHVSISNGLTGHFNPSTASGVANAYTVSATVTYSDFSHISSFTDIKGALDSGEDLSELVGLQTVTTTRQGVDISWDIVDYSDDTVTLFSTNVIRDAFQFEPPQATFYCSDTYYPMSALAAGSYSFVSGATTYYFTTTAAVPAGGRLRMTESAWYSYASREATTEAASGTVSTTAISGATSLGVFRPNGLAAGDYSFVDGSTTYYFTTTAAVPVGGQMRLTSGAWYIYTSPETATETASGSVGTTAIAGATSLGTCGSIVAGSELNLMNRVNSGSNNYGESLAHRWLNSATGPDVVIPSICKYSRPYSPVDGGFLYGFDADELAVVDDAIWACSADGTYQAPACAGGISVKGQEYSVTSKFALAVRKDIGLNGAANWKLFEDAENADRIKKYNGSARNWWLRDYNNNGTNEYTVHSSGGSDVNRATNTYGLVAACKISKSV